jgi:hypothetical protein
MSCIKNKNHKKLDTVCEDCLKEIDNPPYEPDLNQLEPELRALFTQLTLQNKDLSECWKSKLETVVVNKKRLRVENVLYAFYKGDIGNYKLKRICRTVGCVNPAHHRSRFESPDIFKSVRVGYNRKHTDIKNVSDAVWFRLS